MALLFQLAAATTAPDEGWFNPEMRAAFVGAIVGGLFGLIGGIIPFWWSLCRENKRTAEQVRSWRIGLSVELEHILNVTAEAMGEISKRHSFTKRLNSDFLEATRFKWCEFDRDKTFLAALSNAYRNVVHSNGMLDRLEKLHEDIDNKIHEAAIKFNTGCTMIDFTLNVTEETVLNLKGIVDKKITLDRQEQLNQTRRA